MIMFFRKLSESWIAKLLMILLSISMMMLFGISGMTSMWGKDDTAIVVGNEHIKAHQLMSDFQRDLKKAQALMGGKYLSPQDAIKMGMMNAVVQQRVSGALKNKMTEDMETVASDAAVRNYIINNPNFQTLTGQFDRNLFMAYLNQMQLSENQFSLDLRQELAQKHVFDAIRAVVVAPNSLTEKVYAYGNETRDLDVLLVHTGTVPVSKEATEEELQDYYAAMEDQLYAPEYRQLSLMKITPETVSANFEIDEKVIQDAYNENLSNYTKPERRKVDQILTKDAASAAFVLEGLTADNFLQVAEDKGKQTPEETDLGWLEKASVLPEIGDAVFSAKVGEILGPVETTVGYHILVVREIEDAVVTPLSEVKDAIVAQLKAEKAYDIMYEKSREIDDKLGAGEPLNKVASDVGLTIEKVDFVDGSGKDKAGKEIAGLTPEILESAFLSPEGEPSPLVNYENGSVVVQVDAVEPTTLKPFEQVKDILVAEWKKDQQKKGIEDFAQKVYQAARQGDEFKTVALFYHLDEKNLKDVNRGAVSDLPREVVEKLFSAQKGDILLLPVGEDYVVAKVDKVISEDSEIDPALLVAVQTNLNQQMADGMVEELLTSYANKVGVKIDMPLIEETFQVYMKQDNVD